MDAGHALSGQSGPDSGLSAPCRGGSMRGTLKEGDRLWLRAVPAETLRRGDVVAYRSGGQVMAHRIVGRQGAAFRVQGDGHWRPDAAALDPENIIGRVEARERNGLRSPVAGGGRGARRAAVLHAAAFLRGCILNVLAPFYRLARATRMGRWFWRPRILAVHLAGPAGACTKFIHGGRTVARWEPAARRWTCRKPYDLVLRPPRP